MAAKRRHWKEKDGRFWARIAIPVDLRPQFDGKTQLTEPLGGDLRIADRNHAAAVARLQNQLERARRQFGTRSDTATQSSPARRPFTDEEHERAAWAHYTAMLQQYEKARAELPTPRQIEEERVKLMQRLEAGDADPNHNPVGMFNVYTDYELKAGARHFDQTHRNRRLAALQSALVSGETRLIEATAKAYIAENHFDVEHGTSEWRDIAQVLTRAEIEALKHSVGVDRSGFGGEPTDPIVKPPATRSEKDAPVPITSLFHDYILNRQASGAHRDGGANWEYPIESLIKFLGHADARRITRRNLLDWRDTLLASGKSAKTVTDKYLAAVRAVLRWAFENDRLPTNEAELVRQKLARKVQTRERGYTTPEATSILNAARLYEPAQTSNPSNRESAHITLAKRWVPVLCAFTGARITEITQLRKEDLREENARWIIRITPDAGSVKTGQFRDVPLHQQVVALGFIDVVRTAAAGPLFHRAKSADKYLANARVTSGRLGEWLQSQCLVPDGVQPNYGWRHRFKTQGRELGMSDRVLDAIQGHSGKTASDDYGDVTLAAKLKMIDALPDYDLRMQMDIATSASEV